MKRKKILVLSVGLSIIAATLIATIVRTHYLVVQMTRELPPHPDQLDRWGIIGAQMSWFLLLLPVVFLEFNLLISVYRLAFSSLKGGAKACCILSAVLSASSLILQLLIFTGVITYEMFPNGQASLFVEFQLLTLWPVVLATFILNLVPSPKKKETLPDDSAA